MDIYIAPKAHHGLGKIAGIAGIAKNYKIDIARNSLSAIFGIFGNCSIRVHP
jgi:hypothetical protein